MIAHLRKNEEIMLYGNILSVSEKEQNEVAAFLLKEFENEAPEFPFTNPGFDKDSALWGAQTIYIAAQLMLYRENKESDLDKLLPAFKGEITPAAILSADLCMRFVPHVLVKLKLIDTEDKLISILEAQLKTWHYSGVSYPMEITDLNFEQVCKNKCLQQLYVNRVIENKKLQLANHPALKENVFSDMGIFGEELWKDFKTTATLYEQ